MTIELLSKAGQKGGAAFKHKWTDAEMDIVRHDYDGHNQTAKRIAAKISYLTGEHITFYAVKGQVQKLGIAQDKSPRWTPEEEETLKDLITRYSPMGVAKRMGRSINSVVVKSKRLRCSRRARDGWYTKKDCCEILGVDHHKIQRWMDSGELKASPHTDIVPGNYGGACWHILEADLRAFIISHACELQGRNVDLFAIIQILEVMSL